MKKLRICLQNVREHPKGKRSCYNLPSGNKWDYVSGVLPLLETEKLSPYAMTHLECRNTHEIRQLEPIEDPKAEKQACNDNLYGIFGELEGKSSTYMCLWLGFFVTVPHHFFMNRATIYLCSKGLKLDKWMESIKTGQRGDILVLYRLCLLTDRHCVVHLNRRHLWSTLDYILDDHAI